MATSPIWASTETDDEIYAINATGGPPIEVTYNDMNDEAPMWGSRP